MEWFIKYKRRGCRRIYKDVSINENDKSVSLIFRNNIHEKFGSSVIFAKKDNRLYFNTSSGKEGYKLVDTQHSLTNKYIHFTAERTKEYLKEFIGDYDLEYDVQEDLYFIEKKGDAQE